MFRTVFSQIFALVFASIAVTLALGLGVLALSPPPPPTTVSIATFIRAYRTGSDMHLVVTTSRSPPSFWNRRSGQAEALIGASLSSGVGVNPANVRIVITAPSMYGLLPRSGAIERGQMTIIDVPAASQIARKGASFDVNRYLQDEAVRLPPFIAAIRQADGRFLTLQPRERLPSAWQLRLLAIFALSLLAVAPLVWFGARRWANIIRRLAARVDTFDGQHAGPSVTKAGDALEIKVLEQAFEALHDRVRTQSDERLRILMAVAHDLRTPLTSLRIRSEEVGSRLRTGFIGDIARLDHMIDGILAFARAQKPRAGSDVVDFRRLVTDLVAEAEAQGDTLALTAEPSWVKGNAGELSRAVDNLLRNAGRYADSAMVSVTTAAGRATLAVIDNGPGVPEELIARLTEPFFRVERSRNVDTGGIGLGLATVKAIVESHAGDLRFENVPGGFKVEMRLPAHEPASTVPAYPAPC